MKKLLLLILLITSINVIAQEQPKPQGLYLGGGISKSNFVLLDKKYTGYTNNYVFINLNYVHNRYQFGTNISKRNFAVYMSFKLY